jgi:hypothetical protein
VPLVVSAQPGGCAGRAVLAAARGAREPRGRALRSTRGPPWAQQRYSNRPRRERIYFLTAAVQFTTTLIPLASSVGSMMRNL